MNFPAQVECLNLASIAAASIARHWVRLARTWTWSAGSRGPWVRSATGALFTDARVRSASRHSRHRPSGSFGQRLRSWMPSSFSRRELRPSR